MQKRYEKEKAIEKDIYSSAMADMRNLIEAELQDMRKLVGLEPTRDGNFELVSNGTARSDGLSSMDTSYRCVHLCLITA